jgi:hypothetical protein
MEVHAIEACLNGKLRYATSGEIPEMVGAMKEVRRLQ